MKPLSTRPSAPVARLSPAIGAEADRPNPVPASSHGPAGGDVLALETFLPYRLVVMAQAVSQGLARLYSARFGIVIPEWRTLAVLGLHGRLTATEIGAMAGMHKTKVSRTLTALIDKDLVRRVANPRDRREAFVTLTSEGLRLYQAIVPLARDYAQSLVEGLSPEDAAALERLVAHLEQRAGPLPPQAERVEE